MKEAKVIDEGQCNEIGVLTKPVETAEIREKISQSLMDRLQNGVKQFNMEKKIYKKTYSSKNTNIKD